MTDLRDAFVTAADHVVRLLERDEVATAWDRPSALAEWSVGGLAAHLANQVPTAVRLLTSPPGPPPILLEEHYARAAWVTASLDDEVNADIRSTGDEQAAAGPSAVLAQVREARSILRRALADTPQDRAVLIPWQGWSLQRDDFLTTRMMEIVVHGEDLAASTGTETPPLPPEVLDPVLRLLTRLAVRRHGQGAVVAALTRSERAPRSIAAF
ncbi:maleylpyruvate isomerase N-terminal domain-containing protein [Intrasporangium sp. DVR]|uniref:maleylpyruvate isomerase N-terminal domain-containing protein n=1 Tax=Intrasporangium sp. DVR TaxID=3127867 RepID=UPI00313A55DB